jgi:Family of unknown function (DUF5681)
MTRKNNPPVAARFKKGESGNSKGRPRRPAEPVSTSYLFRKVANEEVEIEVQGCTMAVTRWDALLRQVHTMALNNDFRAARLLHQIRQRFPGRAASGGTFFLVCTDEDLKL